MTGLGPADMVAAMHGMFSTAAPGAGAARDERARAAGASEVTRHPESAQFGDEPISPSEPCALTAGASVPMLVIGADGRIVCANGAVRDLSGYREDELRALASIELLLPGIRNRGAAAMRREGSRLPAPADGRARELMRRDGTRAVVHAAMRPVELEGDESGLLVALSDRSAEHADLGMARAEVQELRAANDHLRVFEAMVARASDAMVIIQRGRVRLFNEAARTLVAPELLAQPVRQAIGERAYERARAAMRRLRPGESATELFAFDLLNARGARYTAEATVSLTELDGRPAVLASIRDITERVEFEVLQRSRDRVDAVARVAAGAAHEFSNALGSLIGTADIESMPQIFDALVRARRLSSALAVVGGQTVGAPTPSSPDRLIEEAIRLIDPARRARVVVSGRCSLPVAVRHEQMAEALGALIDNALEASDGMVELRLSSALGLPDEAGTEPSASGYALVQIIDGGPGMSLHVRSRLFEPFFTTRPGRHGMGAPLAHAVIRSHGGEVTVDTRAGSGTTMCVYLPVTTTPASAEAEMRSPEPAPAAAGRVLLADDDAGLRAVTAATLRIAGYRVDEAGSRAEAERWLRDGSPFDLLVLDIRLGDGSGLDVFRRLDESGGAPPTLFISGYSGNELAGLEQTPRWRFLAKPFTRSQLVETLNRLAAESGATADA